MSKEEERDDVLFELESTFVGFFRFVLKVFSYLSDWNLEGRTKTKTIINESMRGSDDSVQLSSCCCSLCRLSLSDCRRLSARLFGASSNRSAILIGCWMAGQQEQPRVPPPHDAAPSVRPKPLWQPWSDSDGSIRLPFLSLL